MKLVEVMACVDRVAKNGTNDKQHYKYAQASDVYDAVRGELAKRFIMATPKVAETTFVERKSQSGGTLIICTVRGELLFTDAETGEVDSVSMVGQGSDSLDKAVYKAMTGAMKNAIVNKFLIPTGDDPEHEPKQSKTPPPAGAEALTRRMQSAPPSPPTAQRANGNGAVFPNYGKSKGQPVVGASMQDLEFYANGARRTLADASKANFHDKERALLAAITAEVARQQGGTPHAASPSVDEEPPPHDDSDRLPF